MIAALLEFRQRISETYGNYEVHIRFCVKFLLAFCVFYFINIQLGTAVMLKSIYAVIALALVCAVLPLWALPVLTCLFLVTHMCAISLEAGLITAILLFILLLVYFVFRPKYSVMISVSLLAGILNVSGITAIPAGLLCGPTVVFPCAFGMAAYNAIVTLRQNYTVLNAASQRLTNIEKITFFINAYLKNEKVLMLSAAMLLTILLVYIIRRMAYSYAWAIAIAAGSACYVMIIMIGSVMFDISVNLLFLGIAVGAGILISGILHVFCFLLDGNHTEYLQYEDDEYVYYVKAIPKYSVSCTQKKVTKITGRNDADGTEDKLDFRDDEISPGDLFQE